MVVAVVVVVAVAAAAVGRPDGRRLMHDDGLRALVHRADTDELVREIDRCSARGDYERVLLLRELCRELTLESGRQLWGPAQYAEYRLALQAPAHLAAQVVVAGAGRFALGPLTEVVAQHHAFEDLAEGLEDAVRPLVAQERVLRGEDLSDDPRAGLADTGLPGVLQPWEPDYPVPSYRPAERSEPAPGPPRGRALEVTGEPGRPLDEPGLEQALRDLVEHWQQQSTGEVSVAVVEGGAEAAVARLVPERARMVALSLPEAMARMAWAAASGGAHGRRRGGAAGRADAWWVAHAATGLGFPADPDELEFHLEELDWVAYEGGGPPSGWGLRVALAGDGWAAAVDARDGDEIRLARKA